ncbi:hypothetical protein [Streptomyces sp. NBC_00299]|uniref:hypothetical protein n=1 Tax=Streptomyces sp. NBC_00299 TaxID=2975705 RepID=UPI002E2BF395|nr:hypothetical protein [Streptomyces sp. NBC_00299]
MPELPEHPSYIAGILRTVLAGTQLYGSGDISEAMGMTVIRLHPEKITPDPEPEQGQALTVLRALSDPGDDEHPFLVGFLMLDNSLMRLYVQRPDQPGIIGADIRLTGTTTALIASLPTLIDEEQSPRRLRRSGPRRRGTAPHARRRLHTTDNRPPHGSRSRSGRSPDRRRMAARHRSRPHIAHQPGPHRKHAHPAGALPESVARFIRGLEAAQRSGIVEHVRRLCAGSRAFLDSLHPAARAEAEQALGEARSWLTGHEDYQQRVFADLEAAVLERRAWDVRSQLQTATALTRRGASAAEQRVLAAARAFVRQQDHLRRTRPRPYSTPS